MSRQTSISAYLAKRLNKESQSSNKQAHSTSRNRLDSTHPSLLFPFRSTKKPTNNINQTPTPKPNPQTSPQTPNTKNDFSSSSLAHSQSSRRQELSMKKAQSILGITRQQPITTPQPITINDDQNSNATEVIDESTSELQIIGHLKGLRPNMLKCPAFVLIGPFDTVMADNLQDRLQVLMMGCNKITVIEFIKQQMGSQYLGNNVANLQKVEDQQFWCQSMQTIIELLQKNKRCLISTIRTLPYLGQKQTTVLSRLQVFLLVSSMFLCVIPKQLNCNVTSFFQLMTIRTTDAKNKQKPPMRLEKLKCIINYLKEMSKKESIYEQKIVYERVMSYDYEYLAKDRNKTLLQGIVQNAKIESGYCDGIMIDFANSAVGGGFLTNGCAQEEILFSVFPQLSIIKLICEELRDQEAIVIKGARKFNLYQGYSHNFKFNGSHQQQQNSSNSLIVAIDAVDYSSKLSKSIQYSKRFIRRELHKMYVGVQGARTLSDKTLQNVYTGKWGCGVFGGDQYLKFCIQWIVCSDLGVSMCFMQDDSESVREMRLMMSQLAGRGVDQLMGLIEAYGKEGKFTDKGLLNYLKHYS